MAVRGEPVYPSGVSRGRLVVLAAFVAAIVPGAARAASTGSWYPHPADASWTYQWADSEYATTPTFEKITVKDQKARNFTLSWTTQDLGNPDDAIQSIGLMAFQETNAGLVNTDWQSSPPPSQFPILCAELAKCGNSVASVLYQLIWGSRAPVLSEPLIKGATWASKGGANGDVSSASQYMGRELVSVPAFTAPVLAAKVRTDITQAGAIGDPYGSGVRTVWWVYGVGPVKIEFQHAGGTAAPLTSAVLTATSLTPAAPPSDANYFPLKVGTKHQYSWTNTKWMKTPSIQQIEVSQVQNGSARVDVKHVKGPIRVAASYGFAFREDGLTNIWAASRAATLAKLPALGPKFLDPDRRRHFFTPLDLMIYGFNPVFDAYAAAGDAWAAAQPGRDYSVFGVTGKTRVLGIQKVKTPKKTYNALAIQTTMTQPGFAFGSGVRTSYFADGVGLVKLVFRHGDKSVSTVQLVK